MVKPMKKIFSVFLLLLILLSFGSLQTASAQTYRFTLSQYEVEAYINDDGTLTLYYYMVFENDKNADPIDFVDLGLPSTSYNLQSIEATINDQAITGIGPSAYVSGVELPLKSLAIPPGESGTVIVWVGEVRDILYPYDQPDRENYVNFQFMPNYFGSEYDKSKETKYRMTIILPPGVGATEGVYYTPSSWPGDETPEASLTTDGRVYYSWYTENANVHTPYYFGAAFPAQYVPTDSIITVPSGGEDTPGGSSTGGIWPFLGVALSNLPCCGFTTIFMAFSGWIIYQATAGAKKRKLKYLPPKIAIEGNGIKRGLTAVEAAILMETPMDKVLTMIMFGVLKKEAATVITRDPLKIEASDPLPEDLHPYELGFLNAFKQPTAALRKDELQSTMVDLVKSVSTKMKGFSRKETIEYYKDIMRRAWQAVETAQTPEVKSEQYDRTLEWTMLDRDFEERTQRTFTGGPVYVPMWWGRYDPVFRQNTTTTSAPRPAVGVPSTSGSRPSMSMPNIPGSDFAASVINGATGMAAGVVGNLTSFTGAVTNRTNPIPVSTSSSGSGGFRGGGGGGHSCACACACAGCACACAGGGR